LLPQQTSDVCGLLPYRRGRYKRKNRFYPVFCGLPLKSILKLGAKDKISIYIVNMTFSKKTKLCKGKIRKKSQ
jgi:hypothetical protein